MNTRAHVIFKGRVQGVWFRAHTKGKADEMEVTGWVRNNPDGSVETVFEGPEESVKAVIDWCQTSQPHAIVSAVEVQWKGFSGGFQGFDIRH